MSLVQQGAHTARNRRNGFNLLFNRVKVNIATQDILTFGRFTYTMNADIYYNCSFLYHIGGY